MLYIDLRPVEAVKIGNVPVWITGASGRGISGYNIDCRGGWIECKMVTLAGRRVGVNLLYNPRRQEVQSSWSKDAVERTSTHQRGPSGPRMSNCSWTEAGPPSHRLSSPREPERNAVMAISVGVNMLQFCSVSYSLTHTTLSINWEVYFSKDLCLLIFIASLCFCMHMCMYSCSWLYNMGIY